MSGPPRTRRRRPWVLLVGAAALACQACTLGSSPSPASHATIGRPALNEAQRLTVRIEEVGCQPAYGVGSGFLYAPDLVVTVAHVVRNARTVSVRTSAGDGTSWVSAGRVVKIDPGREVAMIELAHPLRRPGDGLSFATQSPRVGEPVDVIGYPNGRPQKTTTGTIRRVGMTITTTSDQGESQPVSNVVQFSASVRPGNSGGPVIDSEGRVAALVEAKPSNRSYGFGVAASAIENEVAGWVKRPYGSVPGCPNPDPYALISMRSKHPDAPGIRVFLDQYLGGIDAAQSAGGNASKAWSRAYGAVTGSLRQGSLAGFERANKGRTFGSVSVDCVNTTSPTEDDVNVTYTEAVDTGAGVRTTRRHVTLRAVNTSGGWQFSGMSQTSHPLTC